MIYGIGIVNFQAKCFVYVYNNNVIYIYVHGYYFSLGSRTGMEKNSLGKMMHQSMHIIHTYVCYPIAYIYRM